MFTSVFNDFSSPLDSVEPEKSKIPFIFAAVPHELFEKELDATAIGVYCAIAKFVNLRAQTKVGDRKLLVGITIPVSQQKIADVANTSRRTVIRKIQILTDAGVLECKKSYRGCYVYQLTIYQEKIDEFSQEENQHQSNGSTKQTSRANYTKPGVPTGDDCDRFASQDRHARPDEPNKDNHSQSRQHQSSTPHRDNQPPDFDVKSWHTLCEDLAHIKDFLRNIKNYNSPPKPPSGDEPADDDDLSWREYTKYAHQFYGDIKSKKFLKEASSYFKDKVDEYGICDDGFDPVWEMIPILLKMGAIHHTSFDQPFGIKAFDKVIDDRDKKKRQQQQREQWQQKQASSTDQSSNSSDNSRKQSRTKRQSNQRQQSSSNRGPHNRPQSAKEAVARYLISRYCLVKISVKDPYTDEEIEQLWQEAYEKYGKPQSPQAWLDDRIFVNTRLSDKGFTDSYTDKEIELLAQQAQEAYRSG